MIDLLWDPRLEVVTIDIEILILEGRPDGGRPQRQANLNIMTLYKLHNLLSLRPWIPRPVVSLSVLPASARRSPSQRIAFETLPSPAISSPTSKLPASFPVAHDGSCPLRHFRSFVWICRVVDVLPLQQNRTSRMHFERTLNWCYCACDHNGA